MNRQCQEDILLKVQSPWLPIAFTQVPKGRELNVIATKIVTESKKTCEKIVIEGQIKTVKETEACQRT